MKILKEENKPLTFKQLVKAFTIIETEDDFNRACGEIDRAFQAEKINWDDHELLYKLVSKIKY